MKTFKLYKTIESTSQKSLHEETVLMLDDGWQLDGEMYIDHKKGRNGHSPRMFSQRLFKETIC